MATGSGDGGKWQTEDFPALKAEAKRVGAVIYFADEAGIRPDYHAGATWAPCGETPVIKATGRRYGLNRLSAVSARGDFRVMLQDGTVTAGVFREFLKRLMVGATRPVFWVVDGHPIHKAKQVKDYVNQQNGKLKLIYLPPYSPQLNPTNRFGGISAPALPNTCPRVKPN